jgi:hypothetical protein
MKTAKYIMVIFFAVCLAVPSAALAGKGYMGGKGEVVVAEEPPADVGGDGGMPSDIEGPLNDKMSDSGKLFGDLYRILRQQGFLGDKKLVPAVNVAEEPILDYGIYSFEYDINNDGTVDYTYDPGIQLFALATNTVGTPDAVVGGEPVLTVIDPGATTTTFSDYGWYAAEIGVNEDETPIYGAAQSPYPAQCVQPVANYARWGNINATGKTGLTKNRLPMVITYDATWNRSECAVNQLDGEVTADLETGELTIPVNPYFIEPEGSWPSPVQYDPDGTVVWESVTYPTGVLWTDLIGEVHFGRLNLSRSPEAVLQSAFDEAVNNINDIDTIAIEIDAAGRLILTKNVYDELLVDPLTGLPLWIETVKKAIDSPLENVSLYVKLMQDGHLVTPGDERAPIDRSLNGGIPLWKLLELEDGPAVAALRPTIDIDKLRDWGMGSLVITEEHEETYFTYYTCLDADKVPTACLCWNDDPVQPELDGEWVMCDNVVSRELQVVATCPVGTECEGPFIGLDGDADPSYPTDAADLDFTAAFLAAAADKSGDISIDMVVYLNSILGINQVIGTSSDGTVDYEKNPVYFNFSAVVGYDRETTFAAPNRGQVDSMGGPEGNGGASTYDGNVIVLQNTTAAPTTWTETAVSILGAKMDGTTIFDNIGLNDDGSPSGEQAEDNILGFTQQSDDDLSLIKFVHTYQIPGLR